MVVNYVKDTSV